MLADAIGENSINVVVLICKLAHHIMLSILIPTYNYSVVNLVNQVHKQSLEAAIEFEIIVVDDFSSDLLIIEQNNEIIKLGFCQYIKNEKNIGRTASRNLLANKAKYKSLLFLDADVLPKSTNFINNFNIKENKNYQIIFGGVCYSETKPERNQILRWKYGKEREAKSLKERLIEPYFIISASLLIKKDVFISTNSNNTNTYGLDILFSNNLKTTNINVRHIDNPVYHLGLETNQTFIKKSLEAVNTTLKLEENNLIDNNLRPLQKSYLKLKKLRLINTFSIFISLFKKIMERNFHSENPNLFWFDLYRLQYFIKIKTKKSV